MKTVLFQTIQPSNKHTVWFCLNHRLGTTTPAPNWTWEWWQWRGTLHPLKLRHYWNLTIRLFSVIYRILVGGSYSSAEMQSMYSIAPADWGKSKNMIIIKTYLIRYNLLPSFTEIKIWKIVYLSFIFIQFYFWLQSFNTVQLANKTLWHPL